MENHIIFKLKQEKYDKISEVLTQEMKNKIIKTKEKILNLKIKVQES
jgi:hypothetical protein